MATRIFFHDKARSRISVILPEGCSLSLWPFISFICSVSITGRRNLRKQYPTPIALKQGLSNWDFVTTAWHFTWWLYSSHERRKNFTCSGENKFTRDGYSKQMCSLEKLHFYINARMVSPADVRTQTWRVCVHIYIMHYAVMRLTYV